MFTGLVTGIGVSIGAAVIVGIWSRYSGRVPGVVAWLFGWFEAKTGLNIPDNFEAWFIGKVKAGVAYANETFGSKLFWRTAIRIAMKDGVSGIADRLEDWLKTINPATVIEAHVPEEFRPLMNKAKQEIAERKVLGEVIAVAPAEKKDEIVAKVAPAIMAMARADIPEADKARPDLESILAYHRELKKVLLSKGTQMPAGVPLPSQIKTQ